MKELAGRRFARLVVLEVAGKSEDRRVLWDCACDCGGRRVVTTRNLTKGAVRSCGCLRSEVSAQKLRTANARKRSAA